MQPYIIRRAPRNGVKVAHFIADQISVSRVDETRSTGRTIGGLFREVENTGRKVRGWLRIATRDGVNGHGITRGHETHVHTEPAAEIKKVVRRVRPEEMAEITSIDGDILLVEAQLKHLRSQRAELVATAWAKAHTVTAKELEALADLPRQASHAMTEQEKADLAAAHNEIRRLFAG